MGDLRECEKGPMETRFTVAELDYLAQLPIREVAFFSFENAEAAWVRDVNRELWSDAVAPCARHGCDVWTHLRGETWYFRHEDMLAKCRDDALVDFSEWILACHAGELVS